MLVPSHGVTCQHFSLRGIRGDTGRYPEITLKIAHERRLQARRALEMGKDPGAIQKAERVARSATFEALATEWLEVQRNNLTSKTFDNKRERFATFVFPYLGKRAVSEIKALDMLDVLKRIEERGRHERAHRVRSECGNVFRYAVVTGRAERDPTVDLRGAIAAVVRRNRPAIVDRHRRQGDARARRATRPATNHIVIAASAL
jgi:hypothetical protein